METSKKLESNILRKSQTAEHKGDGDRLSKISHSPSTSRTQSTKSNKQLVGSSQPKIVKQNLSSLTSRSSLVKASSSSHSTKANTNSKMRTEKLATKSNDDSTVKKRKSREAGYSEKRGLSTIYVPKSTTSKVNIIPNEKTSRTKKDKGKDASASNQAKPRIPSRERRKSRTLSPSEIKMLHSAIRRPGNAGIERNRDTMRGKESCPNVQVDSEEADYEYEDDFEVKKETRITILIIYLIIYYSQVTSISHDKFDKFDKFLLLDDKNC